jgi:hypothetical protein
MHFQLRHRGRALRVAVAAAVAAIAAVAVGAVAEAAAAAGPLRIAYTGSASNTSDVCTINPNGSNKVCVTSGYRPSVAPGGGELFFVDNHGNDPSGTRAIYRANADGTNVRVVNWSPFIAGPESVDVASDGSRIVFDRWSGNGPFGDRQIFRRTPRAPACSSRRTSSPRARRRRSGRRCRRTARPSSSSTARAARRSSTTGTSAPSR